MNWNRIHFLDIKIIRKGNGNSEFKPFWKKKKIIKKLSRPIEQSTFYDTNPSFKKSMPQKIWKWNWINLKENSKSVINIILNSTIKIDGIMNNNHNLENYNKIYIQYRLLNSLQILWYKISWWNLTKFKEDVKTKFLWQLYILRNKTTNLVLTKVKIIEHKRNNLFYFFLESYTIHKN